MAPTAASSHAAARTPVIAGNLVADDGTAGFVTSRGFLSTTKVNRRLEMDFFARSPRTNRSRTSTCSAPMRVRHAYRAMKPRGPRVRRARRSVPRFIRLGRLGCNSNIGRSSWGVLGQDLTHRNPQLRLSKTVGGDAVSFEVAAAAVRPVQRHLETPRSRWPSPALQAAAPTAVPRGTYLRPRRSVSRQSGGASSCSSSVSRAPASSEMAGVAFNGRIHDPAGPNIHGIDAD